MAPGDLTQGTRVGGYSDAELGRGEGLKRGAYWRGTSNDGPIWLVVLPNGMLGSLAKHEVTEHDDGTITVSPSILTTSPGQPDWQWHGYLERGVWREV